MPHSLRTYWPLVKWLFTVAVLVFVGRQFARDLSDPRLWQRSVNFGWLAVAGVLYLLGLGMSGLYWLRLLRRLGQRPDAALGIRAYYLGHFGKYIPGKAWALVMRVGLARAAGVAASPATISTFYEVMTTMAAGALLAAILFAVLGGYSAAPLDWEALHRLLTLQDLQTPVVGDQVLAVLALGIAALVGAPLLPAFFNRVVHRLSLPFRDVNDPPPHVPLAALAEGFAFTACGWLLHGASLGAVIRAIVDVPLSVTFDAWSRYTASVSLAYVIGFLVILVPNGLAVREYFLSILLAPYLAASLGGEDEARAVTVLAVILLRVTWIVAELILAGPLYVLPWMRVVRRTGGASDTAIT